MSDSFYVDILCNPCCPCTQVSSSGVIFWRTATVWLRHHTSPKIKSEGSSFWTKHFSSVANPLTILNQQEIYKERGKIIGLQHPMTRHKTIGVSAQHPLSVVTVLAFSCPAIFYKTHLFFLSWPQSPVQRHESGL